MIIAETIFDNFKTIMSGLENGLQVRHITTPTDQLRCCQDDEEIEAILVRSDLEEFDQIPVKRQETIIGLLKRRECSEGAISLARDYMHPLGEGILVSADTPLLTFIEDGSLDRIVISGTKIYGLVTRSDLLKLPVSLLGFALTNHAETLMLNIIHGTGINSERWLKWIPRHKDTIERDYKRLISKRSQLNMLELTYITDKSEILRKLAASEEFRSQLPEQELIDQLKEIADFRNSIAHTGNTSNNDDILQELIDRLRLTHNWIKGVEQWQKAREDF